MPSIQMTRDAVLALISDTGNVAGKQYVIVDLRRNDFVGGHIRGSINLPAQTLQSSLPTLYNMCKAAGVQKVIWYCMSSRGRGTRGADLFSNYLQARGDSVMESIILVEGIRGWANAGDKFTDWLDEYDASYWESEEK
ncbi:hypothetical protein PFICI_08240 [Pestalotiopsis fici W106-1]|uniref:Rhodanese domain-containing protein n=1 Tax=Pestalotiopsis fici (strain W106-1 / CGMCC3.15140) TaxID=1229662 RepID=W3X6B5_PESFW|nr:uncharacterized protein PFICI_08240 [Pestalotiopsis fici W106-1]ETS80711.1 hypothetical protein PFICI_08240 [Pestalotiopsis fici W106-1]